jgi:hypothetical protein
MILGVYSGIEGLQDINETVELGSLNWILASIESAECPSSTPTAQTAKRAPSECAIPKLMVRGQFSSLPQVRGRS